MVAQQKPLSVTSTHAIQPLPSPSGVRVGVDELDPTDPNGVIATWLAALKTLKANSNFKDEMSYFRLAGKYLPHTYIAQLRRWKPFTVRHT